MTSWLLRGDCCFPIEVKTTKAEKLYFSGRTMDQLQAMIREGERSNLMPLYAHRRKGVRGDSWRLFRVKTKGLTDRLRTIAPLIPPLPLNRNGTPFIDWEQGMPLNEFIEIVCQQDASSPTLGFLQGRIEFEQPQVTKPSVIEELLRRRSA